MFNNIHFKRSIIYTVLAIIFMWVVVCIGLYCGMLQSQMLYTIFSSIAMFTPLLANVFTRLITRQGFSDLHLKPNFKDNYKDYIVYSLLMIGLIYLGVIVYYIINFKEFNYSDVVATFYILVIYLLLCTVISPFINIIFTFGEETGWRGYLLFELNEITSKKNSALICGFVWGFWHIPLIVLGHNYGTNYIGYPWSGIIMMIIFTIFLSIVFSHLSFKTNNCFGACMLHSIINSLASVGVMFYDGLEYNTLLGPTYTGIICFIPTIIICIIMIYKKRWLVD